MDTADCQAKNVHPYQLAPEDVRRDNSDLFRFSIPLDKALRKERFAKAKPELYINYCEAVGILGTSDPFPSLDMQLDMEKFIGQLSILDASIMKLYMFKMTQPEIAQRVGVCQATVCNRMKLIRAKFAEYYK